MDILNLHRIYINSANLVQKISGLPLFTPGGVKKGLMEGGFESYPCTGKV